MYIVTKMEQTVVKYQLHSHTRTCMKKNKPICSFYIPTPRMSYTIILSPFDDESDDFNTASVTINDI